MTHPPATMLRLLGRDNWHMGCTNLLQVCWAHHPIPPPPQRPSPQNHTGDTHSLTDSLTHSLTHTHTHTHARTHARTHLHTLSTHTRAPARAHTTHTHTRHTRGHACACPRTHAPPFPSLHPCHPIGHRHSHTPRTGSGLGPAWPEGQPARPTCARGTQRCASRFAGAAMRAVEPVPDCVSARHGHRRPLPRAAAHPACAEKEQSWRGR